MATTIMVVTITTVTVVAIGAIPSIVSLAISTKRPVWTVLVGAKRIRLGCELVFLAYRVVDDANLTAPKCDDSNLYHMFRPP